jgi:hypothetical protein
MNWAFDLDSRRLTDLASRSTVSNVPLAYPDKYPVSLTIFKSGDPYLLTGSVVYTLKASSRPLSQELAQGHFTASASYIVEGILDLATSELDAYLQAGGTTQLTLDISVLSGTEEVSTLSVPAPTTRRYYVAGAPGPTSSVRTLATQAEAEEGADNTKWMSPLRTREAIEEFFELRGIEYV